MMSLFISLSDCDVLLIKDIFGGGRGGERDVDDDETGDEGDDSCGAFVLKIFSGVAAG